MNTIEPNDFKKSISETVSAGNKTYDAVVIGSGIGGMVSALELAGKGNSVLLLEAGKQYGGYMNPFRRSGYEFNPGLHYIGESGPTGRFRKLLDDLGVHVDFKEMNPDGFDRFVFPGYSIDFPKGLGNFRDRLVKDFPAEKRGLDEFFLLTKTVLHSLKAAQNLKSISSLTSFVSTVYRLYRWRSATLSQLLSELIHDPLLKAVLSAQCGNAGLPPGKLSAIMHLIVVAHYSTGGYVPAGGSGTIRDGLIKNFAEKGGEMRRNTKVQNIISSKNGVSAVCTDKGELIKTHSIISNASAKQTWSMISAENKQAKMTEKVNKTEQSLGSFMLFLGLNKGADLSKIADRNIWFYNSTDIDAIYAHHLGGGMPKPDNFFLHSPTTKDPSMADGGKDSLELVAMASSAPWEKYFDKPVMRRGEEYQQKKEDAKADFIKAVESYVPDLKKHLAVTDCSTPATNLSFALSDGGGIYGPAHIPSQLARGRFLFKTPVPGLTLCGSSTIGCGVNPSAVSGKIAAKITSKFLKRKGIVPAFAT